MRRRTRLAAALAAAAIYFGTSAGAGADPVAVPISAPPPVAGTASDLVGRFGFAGMFQNFGDALAAGPRLQGVTDERFLAAWEGGAHGAFANPALSGRLGASLAATLTGADLDAIGAFLDSGLGLRIAAREQAVQAASPGAGIAEIAKGQTLWMQLDGARRGRIDELLALTGADLTFDVLAESLRGMAMGMRLAAGGDLDVGWSEVDAGIVHQLDGMKASLADAARAVAALTYAGLSDAELDAYLDFLRSEPARRFYGTSTLTIAAIVRETLYALGETVAARMKRVDV